MPFRITGRLSWIATLLPAVLFAAGCAGSATVTNDTPVTDETTVAWSDVEEFDADTHAELPRPEAPDMEHDVPESLMESTADDGIRVVIQGYRVQVFSSGQREEALAVEEEVRNWIDSLSGEELQRFGISRSIAVYSLFKAPYYRVRVGDFASRSRAEPLSTAIGRMYDGALIVPDMVEVMR